VKIENFEINYSKKKEKKSTISNWFASHNVNSEQELFPVVRSMNVIKIVFDMDDEATHFKLGKTAFEIGFTSEILELVNEFK
jgi:hypothetical protein